MKKERKYSYTTSKEEFSKAIMYGNYECSKFNKYFIEMVAWFLLTWIFDISIGIFDIIIPISLSLILIVKISGAKEAAAKCIRMLDDTLDIKITLNDDKIIYRANFFEDEKNKEIIYKNIRYILETKDYLLLIAERMKEPFLIIPIKKYALKEEKEVKEFLMKKCRNLAKFKITSAELMYYALKLSLIAYIISLVASLLFR